MSATTTPSRRIHPVLVGLVAGLALLALQVPAAAADLNPDAGTDAPNGAPPAAALVACGLDSADRRPDAGDAAAVDPAPAVDARIHQALGHTPDAAAAVAALRAIGPRALDGLHAAADAHPGWGADTDWDRVVDAVAQQRDARGCWLYWHTNLAAAQAEALRLDRPIVALRLLGRLTDERSCANSRFFRAVLYRDPAVAAWLHDHAVLLWTTERPAPQVTIDCGDGHCLHTTIGGNSVHVILAPDGTVLDALPGFLAPRTFLALASEAVAAGQAHSRSERLAALTALHARALAREADAFTRHGIALASSVGRPRDASGIVPVLENAQRVAVSKSLIELPMLEAIGMIACRPAPVIPDAFADELAGDALALGDPSAGETARLSEPAAAMVLRQLESRAAALGLPREDAATALLRVASALARDTAVNEFGLHPRIHRWLGTHPQASMAETTTMIYADVFATPASDPWMGLAPSAWDGLAHADSAPDGARERAR